MRKPKPAPKEFADQHRTTRRVGAMVINMNESPLVRLALTNGAGGKPYLEPHHVEMGERVRRWVERGALTSKMTTNLREFRGSGKSPASAADLSDMAIDARRAVASIYRDLPADCAGVVIDVCGFLKGLQQVEAERGWPKRSAKLVLRIGLDRLAEVHGVSSRAVGIPTSRPHRWMDNAGRPTLFE
jgi:hypothetical protein